VLLAKEGTILQGMIDRIIEVGISCGIEVNVVKAKVKSFSGHPSPVQVVKDKKHLENVEYFIYLFSLKTHDAICMVHMKKTSKVNLNLSNKSVKCYIQSVALYGADTWRLRRVDQRYLESFEMWCWRRRENQLERSRGK
jgi:hypothetical protein